MNLHQFLVSYLKIITMHFCIVPLLLSYRKKYTWANHKPGSVLDDHPSCTAIACSIQRLTLGRQRATALYDPFLVLLRMGFTRPSCLQNAGELLPHHFNLTTALPVSAECFCCTFPTVTCAGRYPAFLPCGARTFLIHPKDARDCLPYPKYKVQLFLEIYIIQTTFCKGQLQLNAKQSIFFIFSNCPVFLLFSLLFLFYDDILKMYALYGVSLLFTKVISQIKEEQHQWN